MDRIDHKNLSEDLELLSTLSRPHNTKDWMQAFWMPYTGNRDFKSNPRMFVSANDCYFTTSEGRK